MAAALRRGGQVGMQWEERMEKNMQLGEKMEFQMFHNLVLNHLNFILEATKS